MEREVGCGIDPLQKREMRRALGSLLEQDRRYERDPIQEPRMIYILGLLIELAIKYGLVPFWSRRSEVFTRPVVGGEQM